MATVPQSKVGTRWAVDPVHTTIEFAVRHMVIATVKGHFSKFEANVAFDESRPEQSSVKARIDVASLDTREPQRDAHLRSPDFFDAENTPHITYVSKDIRPQGKGRYRVLGDLTIRNTTREVALDAEFSGVMKDPWGNQRAAFSATGSLNRKDFGLNWNMALEAGGWLVGDTVKISIDAELVKQPAA